MVVLLSVARPAQANTAYLPMTYAPAAFTYEDANQAIMGSWICVRDGGSMFVLTFSPYPFTWTYEGSNRLYEFGFTLHYRDHVGEGSIQFGQHGEPGDGPTDGWFEYAWGSGANSPKGRVGLPMNGGGYWDFEMNQDGERIRFEAYWYVPRYGPPPTPRPNDTECWKGPDDPPFRATATCEKE